MDGMDNKTHDQTEIKIVTVKPKYLPITCPTCSGFGTLKYGTKTCEGCQGKTYVLVEAEEIRR